MRTLLCVEDDPTILRNNRNALTENGLRVLTAENLAGARRHLARETPDAIILDIMLPDGNGLDLLKELREGGGKIPVIMLTAWGEPRDISRGYALGATAYLSKPFQYRALLAAIEGIFGNLEQMPESVTKGGLTLKIRSMDALFEKEGAERKIKLPPVEFFLLQLLMENGGRPLKAEELYEKVWGADMMDDPSAVQKAVSRLRKKIEGSGYTVAAVYGGGYRLEREK
jgi:DNA-binding response OmpR family regulator